MLWVGDATGKCVFLNTALRAFWGVDPQDLSTFDWGSTLHPDDIDKLAGPFGKAMAEHLPFHVEARYRRADGQYRTMRTDARPLFDDRDGSFIGMTGVNTDITEQLAAEQHTRMLMGELNHRTKNLLAVVQAVARQTIRHTPAAEFDRTFTDRLLGLGASNDLLLKNDWSGVRLEDLVQAQLAHLHEEFGRRLLVSGPEVRIAATAAQTLGMALHELSTNSLKHGALGRPEGRIELAWRLLDAEAGPVLEMSWIESGVGGLSAPTRKGFGHTVVVDMVASTFDADVDVAFQDGGFRWSLRTRGGSAFAS